MIATAKRSRLRTAILMVLLLPMQIWAGGYFVPGDPKAGIRVFFEKGCGRCHSILGEGGRSAPDLARSPAGHLSAAELVGAMWNHAPAMWQKMRLERIEPPKFTPAEMTDLFAFLYSIRSLDEPGDAARGRKLLEEKHCVACHAISGQGGGAAPDLRRWGNYRNPVSWVQAMWNHGAAMQAMMTQRGLVWPKFEASDMSDVIAAVRGLGAQSGPRNAIRKADPESGRRVFLEKHCEACHAIRGEGSSRGPDLGARALPRTLGQFAGGMWNHAPAMWSSMQARGLTRPQFSNQEMADLIAYLFTQRYFEASGSSDRGARLFDQKGCLSCHGRGPAPALTRRASSPVEIATALWNHGPLMFAAIQQHQLTWPRFGTGEIVDLMEFINRGTAPVQTARSRRRQP